MSLSDSAVEDPVATSAHDAGRSARRRWLAGILLVALALRIGMGLWFPASDWADEIFQTREPAHRLAYGYGVVTWEFRDGIRSWVFPAFLALVMRATDWLAPGSLGYGIGILVMLSAISLTVVWAGFAWGHRAGGMPAAVITGATCAVWYELVYYAPQALTEVVAAHLLLPGLLLAETAKQEGRGARIRLLLAGTLIGTAVALRVHMAVAVLAALLWICRTDRRKWTPMLAGFAVPALVFGLVDAFTWGVPFVSYWRAVVINIAQGKSATYGKDPATWLLQLLGVQFGPLLALAVLGVRRAPVLALTALGVIATHSAFAHKEYRYVYPAVPLLCVLIGLGIAAVFERMADREPAQVAARAGTTRFEHPGLAAAVVLIVGASALWGASYGTWDRGVGYVQAFRELSVRRDVCGVGVDDWAAGGGYAHLHHDVPMYLLKGRFPHEAAAFNYAASWYLDPMRYPQYRQEGCWANFCLYRRAGGCAPAGGYDVNEVLRQTGR